MPSEIGALSTLETLDLSGNQWTALPLDLGHNRFSEIPPVLSQLRPLLSLDLRGNPPTTCHLPWPWQIDRYIYPPDGHWDAAHF